MSFLAKYFKFDACSRAPAYLRRAYPKLSPFSVRLQVPAPAKASCCGGSAERCYALYQRT
jgi:hypothetical protein